MLNPTRIINAIKKQKGLTKFYEIVINSTDYDEMIKYLLKAEDSVLGKTLFGETKYFKYIEEAFLKFFTREFSNRMTSEIKTIKLYHDINKEMWAENKSTTWTESNFLLFIYNVIKEAILLLDAQDFADDYVSQIRINETEDDKSYRLHLLHIFNEFANSRDYKSRRKFKSFVDSVNEKIIEQVNYNIPAEQKILLLDNMLDIKERKETTQSFWAQSKK